MGIKSSTIAELVDVMAGVDREVDLSIAEPAWMDESLVKREADFDDVEPRIPGMEEALAEG